MTGIPPEFATPVDVMRHAISLAERGRGAVEPNPAVGAVVVDDELNWLGEGYHERFGGSHAEINAIQQTGDRCRGATLFCTLEPCSHWGKTPPCADAVIQAGLKRVVIGTQDPAPHVNGAGIARLQAADIDVEVGLLADQAQQLIAPFVTLTQQQRPWVHAKWAMTLDGRIASRTGHSQWISNASSRALVHELRGRMDAILVGAGTVLADDPQLTARPAGPRTATRIVLDGRGRIPVDCQLTRTIAQAPLLVATTDLSSPQWRAELSARGAEVLVLAPSDTGIAPLTLLRELGQRRCTNLLIEGGAEVLGHFFDAQLIDECHVYVAPLIVGGAGALAPVGGIGLDRIPEQFGAVTHEIIGSDVYIHTRRTPVLRPVN